MFSELDTQHGIQDSRVALPEAPKCHVVCLTLVFANSRPTYLCIIAQYDSLSDDVSFTGPEPSWAGVNPCPARVALTFVLLHPFIYSSNHISNEIKCNKN